MRRQERILKILNYFLELLTERLGGTWQHSQSCTNQSQDAASAKLLTFRTQGML